MYEEYGITQYQYNAILDEYGEVNYYTISEYFNNLSEELSNKIKKEVYKYKKETTNFMDNTKTMFFIGLLLGYTYTRFSQELDNKYEEYEDKMNKITKNGYKNVKDIVSKEEYLPTAEDKINSELKELLPKFELDRESTKTEDDKYLRLIKNYYKQMEKSVQYFKRDITLKEYLSQKVDKFDKLEKTVAYYNKDGTIRAYFDIASYDSMIYNTNLTRTGVRESIKTAIILNNDVVYVDPHPFACPECQIWQGKFYSISGKTDKFYGEKVIPLEVAIEGESGIGLLHPNCTHIPRMAYPSDKISYKYSSDEWEEKYNKQQKIQALKLKKSRLKNDNKIYRELEDEEAIDKNRQKIRNINERIKELSK